MPEPNSKTADLVTTSLQASARGLALFVASFTLLNLAGELVHRGFDASIWWIDLRYFPPLAGRVILFGLAIVLLDFVRHPAATGWRRNLRRMAVSLFMLQSFHDAIRFQFLIEQGEIASTFRFPVSLAVSASFAFLLFATFLPPKSRRESRSRRRDGLLSSATFAGCLVGFPLLQMFCFGATDYRRPADAAVIFGCRVFRNGELSIALADRVRSGVQLYQDGLCEYLIMSGGPGPGDIHETDAMRRYAIELGVPEDRILTDPLGLSTHETVAHTLPLIRNRGFQRVLAVSHFFHLPRIKLSYGRAGFEIFTVPASQTVRLWRQERLLVREVLALWAYYARPIIEL